MRTVPAPPSPAWVVADTDRHAGDLVKLAAAIPKGRYIVVRPKGIR